MSRLFSTPLRLQCVAAIALLSSCSDDELRQQEIPLEWSTPEASPLLFDEAPGALGLGGEAGSSEEVDESEADDAEVPSAIEVDPPRRRSIYCGDGAWDPATEECDSGPTEIDNFRAVCSATCQTRDVLAVAPGPVGSGASRHLGLGRHPMAGSELAGGVVWVERGQPEELAAGGAGSIPQVVLQTLEVGGNLGERLIVADAEQGQSPVLASQPVVAALPDGRLAVAYNDLNGDGSELGIAVRYYAREGEVTGDGPWLLDDSFFANTTTIGAQQDADLLWTRSGLVSAWVDWSDPLGPRVVSRTLLTEDLGAGGLEEPLTGVGPAVGEVGLSALPLSALAEATTDRAWAAVYRSGLDSGAEEIAIHSQSADLSIQPAWLAGEPGDAASVDEELSEEDIVPLMPGHLDDSPALAHLSGDRVLVAFTVGTDPENTGVASVFRIWLAVVHLEFELVESVFELEPTDSSWGDGTRRSLRQPTLTATQEGSVYLAWRSEGALGQANGEDLWLKRFDWDAEAGELLTSHDEVSLARDSNVDDGDQRSPVLASMFVPGSGTLGAPALGIAFEDWGIQYDAQQARPEVILQVAPTPLRRGPEVDDSCLNGSCGVGEGPCAQDSDCESGLECHSERGPWYGRGHKVPVCEPAGCNDGELNGDEVGIDCGGSCGLCFECLDETTYGGTADYCSLLCSCSTREGDCDADYECETGLSCVEDSGELVGLPAPIDLCDFSHCHDEQQNFDEARRDCGGEDCAACVNGSSTHCLDVECSVGEGDCLEAGAVCADGLTCSSTDAPLFGLNSDIGVCVEVTCPEDRGDPYAADFCSEDCKCPAGYGVCDSDAECAGSRCVPDRGLYFDLAAEDAVCVPDHCFDHIQNYGETSLDCGGVCGTECPICEVDPLFRSVEDSSLWGRTVYSGAAFEAISSLESSPIATDGAASLAYTGCGYTSISSDYFTGAEFEIVGETLLVDLRVEAGAGGNAWDWLGELGVSVLIDGTSFELQPSATWTREVAGEWQTLRLDVPEAVRLAFLEGEAQLQWRLAMNRNCSAAGASTGAILVDHFRFGGVSVFRSDCGDDGGTGTGGASGSGGGSSTGGADGSGGSGTGGTATGGSGTGGSGSTAVDALFGFEDLDLWSNASESSAEATQGVQSLAIGGTGFNSTSAIFRGTQVVAQGLLAFDYRIPPDAAQGNATGQIGLTLDCPNAGIWGNYLGQIPLWDKANGVWLKGSFNLSAAQQAALGTAAQCTIRIAAGIQGHQEGSFLLLDNLRFEEPGYCVANTQASTAPFVSGVTPLPDGSTQRPYRICNEAQLKTLSTSPELWKSSFLLESDLGLGGLQASIGNSETPFQGSFDGQGHSLWNLDRSGSVNVGLFGVVVGDGVVDGTDDGLIEDLIILDSSVSGSSNVGVLIGSLEGGVARDIEIWNSRVESSIGPAGGAVGQSSGRVQGLQTEADVSGAGTQLGGALGLNAGLLSDAVSLGSVTGASDIGGLVGQCLGGRIQESQSHGAVEGQGEGVGGLVGVAAQGAAVVDSWASGSVSSLAGDVGGLIGSVSESSVESGHATGLVVGQSGVGGLVGSALASAFVRSSASGSVSGDSQVGGLVGLLDAGSSLKKCAARGAVTAIGSDSGGLAGVSVSSSVRDSFADGGVEGSANVGGLIGLASESEVVRTHSNGLVSGAAVTGALIGSLDASTALARSFARSDGNDGLSAIGAESAVAGVELLTLAQFAQRSTFKGWDFYDDWGMRPNQPELSFESVCGLQLACADGLACVLGECVAEPLTAGVAAVRVDTSPRPVGNAYESARDGIGRELVIWRQATLEDNSYDSYRSYASNFDPVAGTWSEPHLLMADSGPVRNMASIITPQGYGIVAWTDGAVYAPNVKLWAAVFNLNTGDWSEPFELQESAAEGPETVDMAVLPDGRVLAAWAEYGPEGWIGTRVLSPDTLEMEPQVNFGHAANSTVDSWLPEVAVSSDGTAALAWVENGADLVDGLDGTEWASVPVVVTANLNQSNPTWSAPQRLIDDSRVGLFTFGLDVAVANGGEVTVVASTYRAEDVGYSFAVRAARCQMLDDECIEWDQQVIAQNTEQTWRYYDSDILMSSPGEAWVATRAELRAEDAPDGVPRYFQYAVQLTGGEWQEPVNISGPMDAISSNRVAPAIDMDAEGNTVVAWNVDQQVVSRRYDSVWDTWDDAVSHNDALPSGNVGPPYITMTPNGGTSLLWQQYVDGAYHLYSARLK